MERSVLQIERVGTICSNEVKMKNKRSREDTDEAVDEGDSNDSIQEASDLLAVPYSHNGQINSTEIPLKVTYDNFSI